MKKFLQKKLKNEKGLTLVELLAVIVILGIIAAIAVPAIGNIIDNSRVKAIKADAQTVMSAANMYFTENGDVKEVTLSKLKTDNYIDDLGSMEKATALSTEKVEKTDEGYKITATGKTGKKQVVFTGATKKDISSKEDVPGKVVSSTVAN